MSFLIGLLNGAKSLIWDEVSQSSFAPLNPKEVFCENLASFSAASIDREDCIAECVKCVEKVLELEDCNLSETSQTAIESYFESFDTAVSETSYLSNTEVKLLKGAFQQALCDVVEQKWVGLMATSFYPIHSFSLKDEKIAAAQKWTHEFILGVKCFHKWEGFSSSIQSDVVAKLQKKTLLAFQSYSLEVAQNKMKSIQSQMEKDPVGFAKRMETVEVIVDGSSTSQTILDSECDEFAKIIASCLTRCFEFEEQTELLRKCIWHGYALEISTESILDSDTSQRLFADVFTNTLGE